MYLASAINETWREWLSYKGLKEADMEVALEQTAHPDMIERP